MVRVWRSVFRARGVLESARCSGASDNVRRCQSTKSYARRHPARVLPCHLAAAPRWIFKSCRHLTFGASALSPPLVFDFRLDTAADVTCSTTVSIHLLSRFTSQHYSTATSTPTVATLSMTECLQNAVAQVSTPCPEKKMPIYFSF